jgi:23S rRNA maturation mini-RNase III
MYLSIHKHKHTHTNTHVHKNTQIHIYKYTIGPESGRAEVVASSDIGSIFINIYLCIHILHTQAHTETHKHTQTQILMYICSFLIRT